MDNFRSQLSALFEKEGEKAEPLPPAPTLPAELERPARRMNQRDPSDEDIEFARTYCRAGVILRTVLQCRNVNRRRWRDWKARAAHAREEIEAGRAPEMGDEKCLEFVEATTRARGEAAAEAQQKVFQTKPDWWLERNADVLGLPDADERGLAKVDRVELTGRDGAPMEMNGAVDFRAQIAAQMARLTVDELREAQALEGDVVDVVPGSLPGGETEKPDT